MSAIPYRIRVGPVRGLDNSVVQYRPCRGEKKSHGRYRRVLPDTGTACGYHRIGSGSGPVPPGMGVVPAPVGLAEWDRRSPAQIEKGLGHSDRPGARSHREGSREMTTMAARTAVLYGGCLRPWGSTAGWQIYRIILVGVLGSYLLVASVTGLRREVNTFTS